eukprot:SAG11_NODE_176_length_13359_cov_10.862142_14_plen_102_part_00
MYEAAALPGVRLCGADKRQYDNQIELRKDAPPRTSAGLTAHHSVPQGTTTFGLAVSHALCTDVRPRNAPTSGRLVVDAEEGAETATLHSCRQQEVVPWCAV